MSTDYNNPLTPAPRPLVEQVQVKPRNKGVNIATFIISLVVIAALLGAGGWFLGSSSGYSSAQSDFRTSPQSFIQNAGGTSGFGAGGAGGPGAAGPTNGGPGGNNTGKITAINGNTITLETANSTITVNTDSSTKVTKVNPGATSDLKVGDNVTVTGTTAGTTVNAVNIILGNITGLLGRPGGSGGTGGAGGAPASGTPATGSNG